ncbi:tRNA (cmo5U34)-methyltransferase, partial [Vibrio parahaemolyticus V-223/04]
SLCLG